MRVEIAKINGFVHSPSWRMNEIRQIVLFCSISSFYTCLPQKFGRRQFSNAYYGFNYSLKIKNALNKPVLCPDKELN
jgi:hypothetical protein